VTIYRIKDWDRFFETAVSRKLEHPYWVSVPTKQHGMGLTRILAEPDGTSIFGIWILIVEAVSQARLPRLGYLTDDGQESGYPWTPEDLAHRWRRPVSEMERALIVLASSKVNWIEAIHVLATVPHSESASHLPVTFHQSPIHLPASSVVRSGPVLAGLGQSATTPPKLSDEDCRQRNRMELRKHLSRKRFASDDTALEEWIGLLQDAGCRHVQEMIDCLHWLKREGQRRGVADLGIRARYAPAYEGLLPAWRSTRVSRTEGGAA
jgi:hypothetical protein